MSVTTLRPGMFVRGGLPMDVYRDGDVFVAKIDLPGVDADTLDVDITDQVLTISASRPEIDGEDIVWLARQRAAGTVSHRMALGRGLATDKIEARYADGVLTLSAPISEAAKPRKVEVATTSKTSASKKSPKKVAA